MGMLDQLFAPRDPNTFRMGELGNADDPGFVPPDYEDFSGSVPVRKRSLKEAFDEGPGGLKKFEETHPLTPQAAANSAPQMQGQGPIPGMLGPEMGGPYGALPGMGQPRGGAPAVQQPAVPLPQARPPGAPPPVVTDTTMPANAAPTSSPDQTASAPQRVTPGAGQRIGSPAEGAIDMTDASPNMLSKVWKGIQDNSNTLMGMGAGMMGAPSWATGFGRGFAGAQAGAAQDQKLSLQTGGAQQLYQALIDAKVPRQQAIAATTNPELAKTLIASYIGDKKSELKSIDLPNGTKVSVLHNPWTNEVTNLDGTPFHSGGAGQGALIDPNLTGAQAEEAAKAADPALYRRAMNLVHGDETWPTGRALNDNKAKAATDLARQIDPSLTENNAPLRKQTVLDYGPKGKTGFARTAMSTLMGHAEQYDKLIDQMGNSDMGGPYYNAARDKVKETVGTDKAYLKAKGEAALIRQAVATEAEKALAGRVSVSGIQEMLKPLNEAKGPTEQHAAIKGLVHAMGTRLEEMSNTFDSAMNTRTQGFHMLSPKAREIYKRYGGQVNDESAPSHLPGSKGAYDTGEATPAPQGLPAGWSVQVH